MGNSISMNILETVNDLVEVIANFLLAEKKKKKILVKLAPVGKFHDNKDIVCRIQNFVEFNDVGMRD